MLKACRRSTSHLGGPSLRRGEERRRFKIVEPLADDTAVKERIAPCGVEDRCLSEHGSFVNRDTPRTGIVSFRYAVSTCWRRTISIPSPHRRAIIFSTDGRSSSRYYSPLPARQYQK